MKIYKYPLSISDNFTIRMPIGAEILSFQNQFDIPTLWAAICPNSSLEDRKFSIVGTGDDIDMELVKKFIGTVQVMGGFFVWHLFELK